MQIELDPIASLFSARARAHGGGRLGLRHPKPQARLNDPMTEKEPQDEDMNGRKGTEGEDTNPKTLQLTFGSAKALAALCLPSTIFQTARVVEWQTRTFEGRMPKGMRVQVPPRAPSCCLRGNPKSRVRYSMDEIIGHARDRKNERPFRINFFHPNDLVARSKRTGDAQRAPRHQFCFRFLFVEFRLSKIACSWYKIRSYIPS